MIIVELRFWLKAVLVVSVLLTLYACGRPDYLSVDELKRYVGDEENGLVKTVVSAPFEMRVTYRPTDLMVLQQVGNQVSASVEKVQQARAKFSPYYYFIVRFSQSGRDILDPNVRGLDSFSDLMQTVSFRMAEYTDITTSSDTIKAADCVYDRTFGMGSGTELLFVFDRSKAVGKEWIDVNVREFGLGMGKQTVRFKVRDLEDTPRIFK